MTVTEWEWTDRMPQAEMLFALSAHTPAALRGNAGRLARWLTDEGADTPLADVAHTLALRRSQLPERLVIRAADRATLALRLRTAADGGEPGPHAAQGRAPHATGTAPVFVFSGHGSQWDGMGTGLLAREPLFASVVDRLEPVVRAENGLSLRALLTEDGLTGSGMDRVQPAVYAMQVGLAEVWRGLGIRPGAVIGHSMGEVAAAVVAGALTAEDGARVVCRRSRLMAERLAGTGATALVELDAAEACRHLDGRPGISVAVHSSPRACVVAGLPAVVAEFVAECRDRGLLARLVPGVRIGAHSPLVDPLLGDLRAALSGIPYGDVELPYYSATSDDPRERPVPDAAYWTANLRRPVRLLEAVRAAVQDDRRIFLEVSPHPVVAHSVLETVMEGGGARRDRCTVLGTLSRGASGDTALADTLAALHCAGVPLPREAVPAGRHAELPTYDWQRLRFPSPRRSPVDTPAHPLLGGRITLPGLPVRHVWQSRVGLDRLPWLDDHRVHGGPVLPGTAHAELAVAAACEAFGAEPDEVEISGLSFERVLPLVEAATVTTTLEEDAEGTGGSVVVVAGSGGAATVLARARASVGRPATAVRGDAPQPPPDSGVRHDVGDVYAALRALGQEHGPAFAGLTEVRVAGDTAVSRVARPSALPPDGRFRFHPALLDACLHGLGALLPPGTAGTYLPTGVERLRVTGRPQGSLVCRARLRPGPAGGDLSADVEITDDHGTPVAELTGLRLGPVGEEARPVAVAPLLHRVGWDAVSPPEPARGDGRSLLLVGDGPGTARHTAVATALSAAGAATVAVGPDGSWDTGRAVDGVVLVGWGSERGLADPAESARLRVRSALRLVSGLLRGHGEAGTPPPPLTVLTLRAQRVRADERPDPAQAALRGLVRTLRQERPELRARLVDVDDLGTPLLAAELLAADGPDEVAWRNGERLVARLVAGPPASPGRDRVVVRPGGGYLVTGGTRGLGLATARWLAERGAGAVVLGGRGPVGGDVAEELERVRALGTRVELVAGDVARPGTAERMTATLAEAGFRLRGVVHAAAVLEDAMVTEPDDERLRRVWGPKADGAWRLHEATADAGLDWWIGYSSLASLVGSPGQAEYAAANAFLDAVVALRRSAGLPALTVNWGPWGEIGAVRGRTIPGVGNLTVHEGFAALETLIARDAGQGGVARLSPRDFAHAHPHSRDSSFFATLFRADQPEQPERADEADGNGFDRAALAALTAGARRDVVRARTLRHVGRVLGFTEPDRVADEPLVHLGLDSLSAVRIRNALREDFAVEVPVARLLQGTSALELAEHVTDTVSGGDGPRPVAADSVRAATRRAAARSTAARPWRGEARRRRT